MNLTTLVSAAVHVDGRPITHKWWMDRKLLISLAALLFILPWLWMKRIGVLSYSSDQSPADMTCRDTTSLQHCQRQWPDFFTAIPFICFGYQCHVSSVPVYAGLKRRSVRAYLPLVAVALSVCLVVYCLTGVFGLLTYHRHTCIKADILRNYCPQDPAIDVARVMLILVMITSYPILAFCGRTALDSRVQQVLQRLSPGLPVTLGSYRWWERVRLGVEGTTWLVLSLLLALFVPEISLIINPIGGLAAILMFVFPGNNSIYNL
jgi:sodium-coupled neutral amino acid transporter 7/8